MAFNIRTNICICIMLSFLMMAFCGCNQEKEDIFNVNYLTVTGGIFDASPDNYGSPVEGVTVTMTGYSVKDLDRTSPRYSKQCVSAQDGSYQFSLISSDNLSEFFFVFLVKDEANWRTKHFEPAELQLFLNSKSNFYNSFMKSFDVKDNDFYLPLEQ